MWKVKRPQDTNDERDCELTPLTAIIEDCGQYPQGGYDTSGSGRVGGVCGDDVSEAKEDLCFGDGVYTDGVCEEKEILEDTAALLPTSQIYKIPRNVGERDSKNGYNVHKVMLFDRGDEELRCTATTTSTIHGMTASDDFSDTKRVCSPMATVTPLPLSLTHGPPYPFLRRWTSYPEPNLPMSPCAHLLRPRAYSCMSPESYRRRMRLTSVGNFDVWPESRDEFRLFAALIVCKIIVVVALVVLAFLCFTHLSQFESFLSLFLRWVAKRVPWSVFIYAAVFSVLITFFFPAEILVLSAGYVFCSRETYGSLNGVFVAALCCFMGQLGSAALSYWIASGVLYRPLRLLFKKSKVYNALMLASEDGGALFVFLCRLSPVIPFTLSNYCFGCTTIGLASILLGHLGSLPFLTFVVWIGSQIADVKEIMEHPGMHFGSKGITVSVVGGAFAVIAISFAVWMTTKKLREVEETIDSSPPLSEDRVAEDLETLS